MAASDTLTKVMKMMKHTGQWDAKHAWSYLPTPPHGQDMTQGQFLSGV